VLSGAVKLPQQIYLFELPWIALLLEIVKYSALQCCSLPHATPGRCRFYQKLAGMTGTARSAAAEFYEIYGLRVVPIPTNKPPRRKDLPLRLYYTEQDKLAYVVSVVESCWADGRPVLIGTSSVNESEAVLQVLQEWCRPAFRDMSQRVQLLNAKPENVRLEAQVRMHLFLCGLSPSFELCYFFKSNTAAEGVPVLCRLQRLTHCICCRCEATG
jgi:hypothetical protein